jgi:hypothetical protein
MPYPKNMVLAPQTWRVQHGHAVANDASDEAALRALGYTVDGEPEQVEPVSAQPESLAPIPDMPADEKPSKRSKAE